MLPIYLRGSFGNYYDISFILTIMVYNLYYYVKVILYRVIITYQFQQVDKKKLFDWVKLFSTIKNTLLIKYDYVPILFINQLKAH